jgi:hypothetical protein
VTHGMSPVGLQKVKLYSVAKSQKMGLGENQRVLC